MVFRRTLLLGAMVAAPAARAQPADAAMRAAIRRAVAGHVLERHAAFAQAAAGFGRATQAITASDAARAAWIAAALAFQGIRHLRFGPDQRVRCRGDGGHCRRRTCLTGLSLDERRSLIALGRGMVAPGAVQCGQGCGEICKLTRSLWRMLKFQL